jgi:hypothetical protein
VRRLAIAFFLLATGLARAEPALTISCEDKLFAKDSSHQRLVAAFGKQNVALESERAGPNIEMKSVIFPKDPKRKLTVVWDDNETRSVPRVLIIEKPSQWAAPKGIRLGTTLEELERLSGAPFTLSGFGFLGGAVESDALRDLPGNCNIEVTMAPTAKLPKPEMNKVSTLENFTSTDPLMRKAQAVVSRLQVSFPNGR